MANSPSPGDTVYHIGAIHLHPSAQRVQVEVQIGVVNQAGTADLRSTGAQAIWNPTIQGLYDQLVAAVSTQVAPQGATPATPAVRARPATKPAASAPAARPIQPAPARPTPPAAPGRPKAR